MLYPALFTIAAIGSFCIAVAATARWRPVRLYGACMAMICFGLMLIVTGSLIDRLEDSARRERELLSDYREALMIQVNAVRSEIDAIRKGLDDANH